MVFSDSEIFEIAIQIERNGAAFYRQAAKVTADVDSSAMLTGLAEMEDEHEVTFTELRDVLVDAASARDDEMLSHIRAMADNHVFDVGMDPEAILGGDETIEDILSTAIGLEKESVVYYAALKEVVFGDDVREKIQKIILEEMAHIADLSRQREAVRQGGGQG